MNTNQLVADMKPWWEKYRPAASIEKRTPEQRAWDSAILCAAEYVRRRMNYDEKFASELFDFLTTPKA